MQAGIMGVTRRRVAVGNSFGVYSFPCHPDNTENGEAIVNGYEKRGW